MPRGEDVVKAVFGGSLYQQGRGFYVALELLAIVRGSWLLEASEEGAVTRVLPDPGKPTEFERPTHDFARRLMAGYFEREDPEKRDRYLDQEAAEALRSLLLGLHAPVPGRRNVPANWRKWHLYPYPADFIHYDALQRGRKISIERDSFRGGGGLAHRILREDPDQARLTATRDRFRALVADGESALGELAKALHNLDEAKEEAHETWRDKVEGDSTVRRSAWVDQLRSGVGRILDRVEVPDSKRIEALMHWVPFCIARHQQSLAYRKLGTEADETVAIPTVFDCQSENNPIRDKSRREFMVSSQAIPKALEDEARRQGREEILAGRKSWMHSPRTFFTTTMFAVGAANSSTGIRWFTLQPELLEAIVLAKIDEPIPFDKFCSNVLNQQLGIVVDRNSAYTHGISDIDQSTFETNAEHVAETLAELGLLERFSDMTKMVGWR